MNVTGLYVWRDVAEMYLPLESFISTRAICDNQLICVDPDYPTDVELAQRLSDKLGTVRVIEFKWPNNVPGDGSRIGIASQYALDQVPGGGYNYVLNVQADEIYPEPLAKHLRYLIEAASSLDIDCFSIKVLNLEHNMSQYQGGNATSTWNKQSGAGYNRAIKLFKSCPDIRFAHDGWSMDGCRKGYHVDFSETNPIIHAHDNFRDTLIRLRKNAAEQIWTDKNYGHYKASASNLEETREEWWSDPKWTSPDSRFISFLPPYVRTLLGQTKYEIRWELIDEYL